MIINLLLKGDVGLVLSDLETKHCHYLSNFVQKGNFQIAACIMCGAGVNITPAQSLSNATKAPLPPAAIEMPSSKPRPSILVP